MPVYIILTSSVMNTETDAYSEQNGENYQITIETDNNEIDNEIYIVKSCMGKVAVYKNGSQKPFYISTVSVGLLPKADREKIEKGIIVSGRKSLRKILEEYCS